jgi:2-polyprenyl-6-methoxyphenol hydroxylase-like FAD-dependent oxidoreductase
MPRTVKVAVVGTGLAGLTAAHLLTKQCEGNEVEFEVHLFEKVCLHNYQEAGARVFVNFDLL